MTEKVELAPVDGVEVTVVMDNAIDILAAPTETAFRPQWKWDWSEAEQLRAEHGYSLSVTVHRNGTSDRILYDTGLTRDSTIHNLDVLGLDPRDYRAVVLSHGHADHHGGLEGLFGRVRGSMPLVVHPHAWRERKIVFPTGEEIRLPPPSFNDLDREGWQVVEERGPSILLDGSILVTGQIDRVTDFEKGFALQHVETEQGWEPDKWIWDDQAIAINVRNKGLVVLSSCSHSGVTNVLHHVRRVTRIDHIHGFIGGLHLTGGPLRIDHPRHNQGTGRTLPGPNRSRPLHRLEGNPYRRSGAPECVHREQRWDHVRLPRRPNNPASLTADPHHLCPSGTPMLLKKFAGPRLLD